MRRVLVVGIGSSHGDDQTGWLVIHQLKEWLSPDSNARSDRDATADVFERFGQRLELRQAQAPTDLLNWIDGQEILHVVDACEFPGTQEARTFEFIPETRHTSEASWHNILETGRTLGGTHGFDILSVLDLTVHLGTQPERVRFWLVPGTAFEPSDDPSEVARQASHETARRIYEYLLSRDEVRL
ncbi:MAG: hypothetical protein JNM43_08065 [Planctomycetaceae bacterium]|nr:hypothetical protein [Planctomycetaceae bacterium]